MSERKDREIGKRADAYAFDPDTLVILEDGALADKESNADPIDEGLVKNMMLLGVIEPIEFTRRENQIIAVNGRRRIRHLREANKRLRALGKEPLTIMGVPKRATENTLVDMMISANEFRRGKSLKERAKQAAAEIAKGRDKEEVGILFGVQGQTIENWLKFLECTPKVQAAVECGALKATAAAQLSKLSKAEQEEKLKELLDKSTGKATVRKAREIAKGEKQNVLFPRPTRAEFEEAIKSADTPDDAKDVLKWVLGKAKRPWDAK